MQFLCQNCSLPSWPYPRPMKSNMTSLVRTRPLLEISAKKSWTTLIITFRLLSWCGTTRLISDRVRKRLKIWPWVTLNPKSSAWESTIRFTMCIQIWSQSWRRIRRKIKSSMAAQVQNEWHLMISKLMKWHYQFQSVERQFSKTIMKSFSLRWKKRQKAPVNSPKLSSKKSSKTPSRSMQSNFLQILMHHAPKMS